MSSVKYKSGEQDGGSAIGHEIDTTSTLSTSGAKILSIKNAGVEKLAISKDGHILQAGGNSTWTVRPEEGGAGIQAAINSAQLAGGGIIQLLAGTYSITSVITWTTTAPITIQGVGDATILSHDGTQWASFYIIGPYSGQFAIDNASIGATSIYATTHAQAYNVLAGDIIIFDTVSDLDGTNHLPDMAIATARGDQTTGEITIDRPLRRPITSSYGAMGLRGSPLLIKDLKIRDVGSADDSNPLLRAYYTLNLCFENVTFYGRNGHRSGMSSDWGVFTRIERCRFRNIGLNALGYTWQVNGILKSNTFEDIGIHDTNTQVLAMGYTARCNIIKNVIRNANGYGFQIGQGEGAVISHNQFYTIRYNAIQEWGNQLCNITDNFIYNCFNTTSSTAIDCGYTGERLVIARNIVNTVRGGLGILVAGAIKGGPGAGYGENSVVANNIVSNVTNSGIEALGMRLVVIGNIVNNAASGFQIEYAYHATVSGNVASNCATFGIVIGRTEDVTCVGNVIYGPQTYGMQFAAGGSNGAMRVHACSNIFNGNGVGAYVIMQGGSGSAGHVVRNNNSINFTWGGNWAWGYLDSNDCVVTENQCGFRILQSGTGNVLGLNKE